MRDDGAASRVRSYLEAHEDEMLAQLARLVRLESPSEEPEALVRALDLLEEHFSAAGCRTFRRPGTVSGGQLYARLPRRRPSAYQVMVGHCDTVWPLGTLEEMRVQRYKGRMTGPGIYDMKAGLVQMVWALRALHELELQPEVAPVALVTSDEEVGSAESYDLIVRLARGADRCLVLEPSLGRSGRLKTARKGVGRFVISVEGRPAHAGLDPESGASAIVELSHVIQKLHELNDRSAGVSVNVGTIQGGVRPNVVAPESRAVVDVRVPTEDEARRLEAAIGALEPSTPGVRLRIEGEVRRLPMERTPQNVRLWKVARAAGRQLGLQLEEGTAGGGSDGNITSLYAPTLDGLGAVGDGAHARHEFIFPEKLAERTALLALILLAAPLRQPPEERTSASSAPELLGAK